jgi:hypothetical protein
MNTTDHPRLLARLAGAFYLIITACALFAYLYVRGHVIVPGDMPRAAANLFGVFCVLVGSLILRSKFLPAFLGVLMVAAGITYWLDDFVLFLALQDVPYLDRVPVTLIAEGSLALWLVVVGVNETKWREKAAGSKAATEGPAPAAA